MVADLAHHAVVERAPGDWTFRFDRAVLSLEGDGAGNLLELLRRVRCPAIVLGGTASRVMDEASLGATARALGGAPCTCSRPATTSSSRTPRPSGACCAGSWTAC